MRFSSFIAASILLLSISQTASSFYQGCVGKQDGFYTLGCSKKFFECRFERALVDLCQGYALEPPGGGGMLCVDWDKVPACLAGEADLGIGIETGEMNPREDSYEDDEENFNSRFTKINCTSFDDGFYALGCSNKYFECTNGSSFLHDCGRSLFYDDAGSTRKGMCIQRDQVVACISGASDEGLFKDGDRGRACIYCTDYSDQFTDDDYDASGSEPMEEQKDQHDEREEKAQKKEMEEKTIQKKDPKETIDASQL